MILNLKTETCSSEMSTNSHGVKEAHARNIERKFLPPSKKYFFTVIKNTKLFYRNPCGSNFELNLTVIFAVPGPMLS